METQLPQFNYPEEPKRSWFSVHHALGYTFLLAFFAAVVSLVYYWQTEDLIPDQYETVIHQSQEPTNNWKTYTNTEYGFEIRFPGKFNATLHTDYNPELISISDGDEINADIVILPNGEFDRGFSPDAIETKAVFSGREARIIEWDNAKVIFLNSPPNNWGTQGRIEVLFENNSKELMNQILSTFKFIETGN